MAYPKSPTDHLEAAATLGEFAQTAPGRKPERVEAAFDILAAYPAELLRHNIIALCKRILKEVEQERGLHKDAAALLARFPKGSA